jgi:electron transfer flavoprotein-quinone oxidoreductase
MRNPEVLIVGAGPAGLSAAIALVRAGVRVLVLEGAEFAGAENWTGGVLFAEGLAGVLGRELWEQAPKERRIVARALFLHDGLHAAGFEARANASNDYGEAWTVLRPKFDRWLAARAIDLGVTLLTGTSVTGLRWNGTRVTGVNTDRGPVEAGVVFIAEGDAAGLLAREGLERVAQPHYAQGIKAVFRLDAAEIERRFELDPGEGVAQEWMLRDGKLSGRNVPLHITAFLYTNRDSLSVGAVLPLTNLAASAVADHPHLLQRVLATPGLASYLKDAGQVAYGAKVIRAGGITETPEWVRDGLAIGGGGLGLGLEIPYPNFMGPAITSAVCFADAVLALRARGSDYARADLEREYVAPLKATDDYANAELIKRWPAAIHGGPLLFDHLPALFGQLVDADELPLKLARGQRRRALAMQVARLRSALAQGVRMGLGMGPNLFTRAAASAPLSVRFLVAHMGERPNSPAGADEPLLCLLAAAIGHFYGRRLPRFAQRLKFAWRSLRYVPGAMPRLLSLGAEAIVGGVHLAGDFLAYKWKRLPLGEFLLRPYHRHEDAVQRQLDWAKPKATPATPTGWIAPLERTAPDERHLSVPLLVGAGGARQLRNVCPAEVYVVASAHGGVVSQFENCIKCESCRVTVPAIDWNRLSRHRFAYRVPGDGRDGYDGSIATDLALPPRAPLALSAREQQDWAALWRGLRARPAMVGPEWAALFMQALAELPVSEATRALPPRLHAWLVRGKYGWVENEIRALLEDAAARPREHAGLRTRIEHARRRRAQRRQAGRAAFPPARLRALAQEPWSERDRAELLGWIRRERATGEEFVEWLASWSPGLAWVAANHYLAEACAGENLDAQLAAPLWREADNFSNWLPGVAAVLVDARARRSAPGTARAHGMGADGAQPVRRAVDPDLSGFKATPEMATLTLALALGQARVLRARAREYAATRVQFRGDLRDVEGRDTIGKFGGVKAMLAAIERGVVLMEQAQARTAHEPLAVLALVNAQMGPWMDALPWMAGQIFGGMAFSEEEIFAARYRDATLFSQWPAARELTTEDPDFERRLLAAAVVQQPLAGRALFAANAWRERFAALPPPLAMPGRHRVRGQKPLVWQTSRLRYRSGGFLGGQLLAPDQVLTPEHYRRDPLLRRTRAEVLRLLRSGFRSSDPALSYGRFIDAQHGMPPADIDRLREYNAFATVVPQALGGKGWNKAQYSVLSALAMGRKDTSVGLLIMASTSIGTMPVMLGLEKDLPRLRQELDACLDDRAGWERLQRDLDGLRRMLVHPESKPFKAALEVWGQHMQAMFLFPGSALKYLARNYLLAMQQAFETARRRDLERLGRELEVLQHGLARLRADLEDERAHLPLRTAAHERFLQFLGCGQISAFALTEPGAGSDTGGIQTRALARAVTVEPLGNGFWRFTPHGGSAPRVLAEGARFVFENRALRYRLDDGTFGALDDSGWDLRAQTGERCIRAGAARHVFHDIGTVVESDGLALYRYFEISGSKMWITNGSVADRYSVYARNDDGELGLMLERRSEGLRIGPDENKLGQRASPTNELTFDRVRAGFDQVIGYRGHGQVNALETLSVGRGGLVMGCATLAERLLHDYPGEWRREPQLHAMAQAEYERIDTLATRLMGLMDRADLAHGDFRIEAAFSKYLASEGLHRILMWFEKLHGPNSSAREEPIEKWRRDVRILNIYEGTNEVQRFLALKDLPALLRNGVVQPAGDEALDSALQAFRDFAGPRLETLGASVWQDPDQQLRWFPVVEWAAQLYVWCALHERLQALIRLDDPIDRDWRARLREHIASQTQHVQALGQRVREDFAQLDAARGHPADAGLLIARELLNRADSRDEAPQCVGALAGEWVALLRSRYELHNGTLRWAGWQAADLAVLDRLLGWADHSSAMKVAVAVCAPRGLEDRVQRLRAAGAAVLHVVEPPGGFSDAAPVAAVIRAHWPRAARLALGGRAGERAFAAQLAALTGSTLFADMAALGANRRGLWIETAAGVRRCLEARRAALFVWDARPNGRSDDFSVAAWLGALATRVTRIEPQASAMHNPRAVPRAVEAGVPERFTTPAELAAWLKARFGARGQAEAAAATVARKEKLDATTVWVTPTGALAQAGARAPLRLLADLGGECAVLACGAQPAAVAAALAQPGMRGVWHAPLDGADERAAAAVLTPHLEHVMRLVLDAADGTLAAHLAAALKLPLFTGVVEAAGDRASCASGDTLVDYALPVRAVLVAAENYRARALAPPAGGPIGLSALAMKPARASALARWRQRAQAQPAGLASARLIVDVGLGITNESIYKELVPPLVAALARASGAVVEIGATRKVTQELKLLPADRQIGQTGIAVAPELVLALGISGAPQHMSWLGRQALVVAINRDPQAPIFSWHRHNPGPRVIACVGDLQQWVPELARCLAAEGGAQSES